MHYQTNMDINIDWIAYIFGQINDGKLCNRFRTDIFLQMYLKIDMELMISI